MFFAALLAPVPPLEEPAPEALEQVVTHGPAIGLRVQAHGIRIFAILLAEYEHTIGVKLRLLVEQPVAQYQNAFSRNLHCHQRRLREQTLRAISHARE